MARHCGRVVYFPVFYRFFFSTSLIGFINIGVGHRRVYQFPFSGHLLYFPLGVRRNVELSGSGTVAVNTVDGEAVVLEPHKGVVVLGLACRHSLYHPFRRYLTCLRLVIYLLALFDPAKYQHVVADRYMVRTLVLRHFREKHVQRDGDISLIVELRNVNPVLCRREKSHPFR